jgi:hypothetical protein
MREKERKREREGERDLKKRGGRRGEGGMPSQHVSP